MSNRLLAGLAAAAAAWMTGAGAPAAATAASDCHVVVEHADGSLDRRARVGEVDRRAVAGLQRLLNQGPHDVRATFDRLAPRVLQRGQAEPSHGRMQAPVTLLSLECLPARAASATGPSRPAHPPRRAVPAVAAHHAPQPGEPS